VGGDGEALVVGNVLPLSQIPEGTVVSNVEARPGDRGIFGRTSGAYAVIVAQVRGWLPSAWLRCLAAALLPAFLWGVV